MGFTMLELLVVISIFLVITGVVVADIPSFRNKSSLDLIASEVATYVRGAQIYGATQRGDSVANSNISYGIHFGMDTPSNFFLYKNNANGVPEENYNIDGFKIDTITVLNSFGIPINTNSVNIVFQANDYTSSIGTQLEPEIYLDESNSPTPFAQVDIQIRPDRDLTLCKAVRVYGNGQITPAACD